MLRAVGWLLALPLVHPLANAHASATDSAGAAAAAQQWLLDVAATSGQTEEAAGQRDGCADGSKQCPSPLGPPLPLPEQLARAEGLVKQARATQNTTRSGELLDAAAALGNELAALASLALGPGAVEIAAAAAGAGAEAVCPATPARHRPLLVGRAS